MFLVIEGQDFTRPCLNAPLLFISKAHSMTCSQQLDSVSNEGLLVLVTHVYKNK